MRIILNQEINIGNTKYDKNSTETNCISKNDKDLINVFEKKEEYSNKKYDKYKRLEVSANKIIASSCTIIKCASPVPVSLRSWLNPKTFSSRSPGNPGKRKR